MILDMTVGQRLKELREAAGLTLEEAGKVAGTTKQSTSQIEKGVTKVPGGLFLYRWSKRYGVDLEWLITGKGPKTGVSQPVGLDVDRIGHALTAMGRVLHAKGLATDGRLGGFRNLFAFAYAIQDEAGLFKSGISDDTPKSERADYDKRVSDYLGEMIANGEVGVVEAASGSGKEGTGPRKAKPSQNRRRAG